MVLKTAVVEVPAFEVQAGGFRFRRRRRLYVGVADSLVVSVYTPPLEADPAELETAVTTGYPATHRQISEALGERSVNKLTCIHQPSQYLFCNSGTSVYAPKLKINIASRYVGNSPLTSSHIRVPESFLLIHSLASLQITGRCPPSNPQPKQKG